MNALIPRSRKRRRLLKLYLLALVLSWVAIALQPVTPDPRPGQETATLQRFNNEGTVGGEVTVAYHDFDNSGLPAAPVLVLIHGSPILNRPLVEDLGRRLARQYRVIVPDLPGFGASTRNLPSYSTRSHARYVLALLDHLGIERAHWLGYSQGGGVVLNASELAPERVESLILTASIGVQELELLGDYTLNHALYAAQYGLISALDYALPHFGLLDAFPLNRSYARNFLDTDQRPFRGYLRNWDKPAMIIHGGEDFLVPPAAAREHQRLLPQSEWLFLEEAGHLIPLTHAETLAPAIAAFVARTESGTATTRTTATAERRAAAEASHGAAQHMEATGGFLLLLILMIALATLVSEDLACIAAGLLAAQGVLPLYAAIGAAFGGIFIGDLTIYYLGRLFGPRATRRAPLKWMVKPYQLRQSRQWFEKRGPWIILLTRFIPGTRMPTYLSAGIVGTRSLRFIPFFLLAAALWTPLLVTLSYALGGIALDWVNRYERYTLPLFAATVLLILAIIHVGIPLCNRRGRRLWISRWRRVTRWEFWPRHILYPPVILYILYLGFRYRSPLLFTAANPGIPEGGGFVGESKSTILRGLGEGTGEARIAPWILLDPAESREVRHHRITDFQTALTEPWPLVLKPDCGERGGGVIIARDPETLAHAQRNLARPHLAQAYVPGREYGVFYYRHPDAVTGHILSITEKVLIEVTGDGQRTLEELILGDDRAVCMAPTFLARHADYLTDVPELGQTWRLVDVGTHSQGALFLDANHRITPELEQAVDKLSQGFEGFFFGRYDLRAADETALAEGRFTVIELNGVTSEATHIYDPQHSLAYAYRTLFRQWRIAFEIGAANRDRGADPLTLREFFNLLERYFSRE